MINYETVDIDREKNSNIYTEWQSYQRDPASSLFNFYWLSELQQFITANISLDDEIFMQEY